MLTQDLYDGSVEMVYDPHKHLYSANGIIVPSVTGITGVMDKPALIYWAVNETIGHIEKTIMPDRPYTQEQLDAIFQDAKGARFRTSQKALTIGSDAHDWIERYIKSRMLNLPAPELPEYPPVLNAVNSYLAWEESVKPKYLASERRVYSYQYMYSGTVDIVMQIGDTVTVADLKTSKGIYPEYFVQAAAYAHAIHEESGLDIDNISIIRIPKDGNEIEIETSFDIDNNFQVFRACLLIWRWKKQWSSGDPNWQA